MHEMIYVFVCDSFFLRFETCGGTEQNEETIKHECLLPSAVVCMVVALSTTGNVRCFIDQNGL